jgi:hypothetical protein
MASSNKFSNAGVARLKIHDKWVYLLSAGGTAFFDRYTDDPTLALIHNNGLVAYNFQKMFGNYFWEVTEYDVNGKIAQKQAGAPGEQYVHRQQVNYY